MLNISGTSPRRRALWLVMLIALTGPVAYAAPGGPAKTKAARRATTVTSGEGDALRLEEARRANARFLRASRPERPIQVSSWRPADAIQYTPSGEYLTTEELARRENLRQRQSEHLLTHTLDVRAGVHESR